MIDPFDTFSTAPYIRDGASRMVAKAGFNPDQPRDHGRWTSGGGSEPSARQDETDRQAEPAPRTAGDSGASADKLTGAYRARSPGASEGDGRDIARVFELDGKGKQDAEKLGITPQTFNELTPEGANRFHDAILAAKGALKFGAAVHPYPVEDYKNMRMFLAADGKSGFALKGEDIVSAFKHPDTKGDNFANAAVALGVQQGGRKCDAFDTVLPEIYSKNGFRASSRLTWDDSQKPDGWNYDTFKKFNGGRPDVVFMVYDPEHVNKHGSYKKTDGFRAESYDQAVAIQSSMLHHTLHKVDDVAFSTAGNIQGNLHLPGYLGSRKKKKLRKDTLETLYVNRPVVNTIDIIAWAKANGFETTLLPEDMHVTIAFSKTPVDWEKLNPQHNNLTVPPSYGRSVEQFGEACVLRFESSELEQRWNELKQAGASWDYPEYTPHITISWQSSPDGEPEPYSGPIILGPEAFAPIEEDWSEDIVEKDFNPDEPRDEKGKWTAGSTSTSSPLTKEESKAVDLYKTEDFLPINKGLRIGWDAARKELGMDYETKKEENEALRRAKGSVKLLDSAIAKNTLVEDTVVYRAMTKFDGAVNHLNSGGKGAFTDKGFVSTSLDKKIAEELLTGGGALVKITLPKGTHAVRILSEGQQEILLGRGMKFKLSVFGHKQGNYLARAEVVS